MGEGDRGPHAVECAGSRPDLQRGDEAFTPTHVALALLRESQGVPAAVLHHFAVSSGRLLEDLEAELPAAGKPRPAPASRVWTPEDERLLELCVHEARELGTRHYGTEHLLLALLREPAAPAARVLARYGIGFSEARNEVLRLLQLPSVPPASQAG